MDIEATIQFLMETAPQHDARLAEIERNNVLIQQAVLGSQNIRVCCNRPWNRHKRCFAIRSSRLTGDFGKPIVASANSAKTPTGASLNWSQP